MQYTDLIFDLYGTLVDIHTDETDTVWEKTALYFRFYGADYDGQSLKKNFHAVLMACEATAGQSYECFPDIPFETVMAELFRAKNIPASADGLGAHAAQLFRILSIDYLRLYPQVLDALASLRTAGFRLWILSNAQRVFTSYELQALGLNLMFDGIYLSSDYQCRKPDKRFFEALFHEQNLEPSQCLMLGNDRDTDISGAKAAGLSTLYLHSNLTPSAQATANPKLRPGIAEAGCRHFEYEGTNWTEIVQLITCL